MLQGVDFSDFSRDTELQPLKMRKAARTRVSDAARAAGYFTVTYTPLVVPRFDHNVVLAGSHLQVSIESLAEPLVWYFSASST